MPSWHRGTAVTWHRGNVRTHGPVYVYVITNASMPCLVKVEWTKDLEARARKLSSGTAVPTQFEVAWACEVASPAIEALAHERLAWCRFSGRREFFRCDMATAVRAIEACNVPLGPR
ncbi:MAG: GIY-YIG nuclease family protein [Janthinobacterium lividum]